jgi:O-antigen/teichoic acid export membrane protein
MTSVSILAGFYLLARIIDAGRTLVHSGYWRYALAYSLPLIPHTLAGLILAQMDRLLIDRYIGRSEAGLYTLAYQIGELVTLIWTATNAAWVPWFYEQMAKKNDWLIRRRANQYLIGFTVLTAAITIAGPWLLTFLSPPEYWSTRTIVPVVMGGMFFNLTYAFYANSEFYLKQTVYISIGTSLAAAVNVGLNVILLPRFGYPVAAWTTLVAYVLLFLFHAWIVIYRLHIRQLFDFRLMVVFGAGIIALATIISLVANAPG